MLSAERNICSCFSACSFAITAKEPKSLFCPKAPTRKPLTEKLRCKYNLCRVRVVCCVRLRLVSLLLFSHSYRHTSLFRYVFLSPDRKLPVSCFHHLSLILHTLFCHVERRAKHLLLTGQKASGFARFFHPLAPASGG